MQIRIFIRNLRPLIIIDGTHLKGPYLGTMFVAMGMDASNQIVPIAYDVGKWTWFLAMLKECIGEIEGLAVISDRDASINQAITSVFPRANHDLCYRHVLMNLHTRDSRIKGRDGFFGLHSKHTRSPILTGICIFSVWNYPNQVNY